MESYLNAELIKTMYSVCREEMEDLDYLNPVHAMEKTRLCYHRFYRLYNRNMEANVRPSAREEPSKKNAK